jgi:hypothetical protein
MKTIGTNNRARVLVGAVALALSGLAWSQDKAPAKPAAPAKAAIPAAEGRTEVAVIKVTATVEAVDQATRAVTLKDANGDKVSFIAGDEVRNLAQLKKGDVVTIEYGQALAVKLAKTSSKTRERTVTEAMDRAAPGQKPGGVIAREVKVIASIEKIDAKNNIVTLRGPKQTVDVKVQDPAMLTGVKVGDFVEARYTEAMKVSVVAGK